MRVAMGYTQRVNTKDKQGRITSSWLRVRIVVPDGLSSSLGPPYTGKRNLTKKVPTDREHAEWTARFLTVIDKARGRETWQKRLAWLDTPSPEDRLSEAPVALAQTDDLLDQAGGITPA
jgi:hypothetical protein